MKRKLGRNDQCWCGSGKKYKKCHLDRESQTPQRKQKLLRRFRRVWQIGRCFHPNASRQECSPQIISAHTVRRNGDLSVIAKNGHVYGLVNQKSVQGTFHAPSKIGVRQASTFRGFCSKHDNELFSPIEDKPFRATTEQVALLGYRSVCYEMFMKERSIDAMNTVIRDADKGQPLHHQRLLQSRINTMIEGSEKAIIEMAPFKTVYEEMIFSKNFSNLSYYVVSLAQAPEIMCSGATQATHDFLGRRIAAIERLDVLVSPISLSLIATDDGGAAVFTWPSDQRHCHSIMTTFGDLSEKEQPHAIVRFVFEFFENTYYSPDWWDGLGEEKQSFLMERHQREVVGPDDGSFQLRPDDCLIDDRVRAVNWSVQSRLSRFG